MSDFITNVWHTFSILLYTFRVCTIFDEEFYGKTHLHNLPCLFLVGNLEFSGDREFRRMVLPEQNWLVSNNFSVYQNTRSPDCLTRRLSRSWRRSPWSWWCRLTWTWAIKPRPPRLFPEGSRRIQDMLVLLTRIIYRVSQKSD